jgi:hypothetical protein
MVATTQPGQAEDFAHDYSKLEKIEVYPNQLIFPSPRDRAILLVTGYFSGGLVVDLTRDVALASTDKAIVLSSDAAIWPVGNGAAAVRVQVAGKQVVVPVAVLGFDQPAPVSFRTETVAALTRQGCNSGGCHGSPSGKGGFLLSLQAYDHVMDEHSLTRAAQGRRTNSMDPTRSLLLLKPTMVVAHGGGLRLRKTDYAYALLQQWIAEGTQVDSAEGKRCVQLELVPASGRVLKSPHLRQQIVAWAHFEDGTVRDVTRITKFSSSDQEIATVTDGGVLEGHRRGQVAVMARYLDQLVSSQFTLVQDIEGFQWPDPPANNYIDEFIYEKLRQLQYPPSGLCTDYDFIRRVTLDVIGVLPTLVELNEFMADPRPNRRGRLIDRLLERPEHARFWALKWGDLLRLQKKNITQTGVHKFYPWLVEAFEQNMPFDQFARELLSSQGSTYDHPAANYYRAVDTMLEATETTAQLFLGSRIQCAKCHNHPFENWTQDNYYGLNAFFNRVRRKPGLRSEELVIYVSREGEVRQPRTGRTMKPWLPGAGEIDQQASHDRRQTFVDWLTGPSNPFFARVAVNRIWAEVMGQGIVEPVDDFRQSNPPANPALLDKLAEDFVQHGYDQKYILRTILNSRTYQLSSEANQFNQEDKRLFSHAKMRILSAEQLLDAICQVTQVQETFPGLPAGTLATEIPGPDFSHAFLDTFGRPARTTACACERSDDSTLAQAIQLFNGSLIHKKLADKKNRFHRMLSEEKPPEVVLDQLYQAALCRPPTETELKTALEHIGSQETPAEGLEDVCWVLFNSDEFLSQH